MNNNLKVSLITTIKNEEFTIEEFLDSLLYTSLDQPMKLLLLTEVQLMELLKLSTGILKYINNGAPIKLMIAKDNRSVGCKYSYQKC